MSSKIQIRRDTSTNWFNVNPLLSQGEQGYETDTFKFKVGDGVSLWNVLPYALLDYKAKVSATDTTPSYLSTKLLSGTAVTVTKNSTGANETLTLDLDSSLKSGYDSAVTNSGKVNVTASSSAAAAWLTFSSAASGTQELVTSTNVKCVPSTGTLISTYFGIGVSAPAFAQIHVNAPQSSNVNYIRFTSAAGTGTTGTDGTVFGINSTYEAVINNYENQAMRFYTNNTERVAILKTGEVGIGVAAPSVAFEVNGTAKATQFMLGALNTAPTSSSASGTLGEIRLTADALYLCKATNQWVKVALATW